MPEWSNGPHSKCGVRATVPGVRIPLFPPRRKIFDRRLLMAVVFFVSTAAKVYLRKAVGTKERKTRSVIENFSLSIKDLRERRSEAVANPSPLFLRSRCEFICKRICKSPCGEQKGTMSVSPPPQTLMHKPIKQQRPTQLHRALLFKYIYSY